MTATESQSDFDAVSEVFENERAIANFAQANALVLAAKIVAMLLRDEFPTAAYLDFQTSDTGQADTTALLEPGLRPTDDPTRIDFDPNDTEDPLHELLSYYFNTSKLLQLGRRDPDRFQGPPLVTRLGDRDSRRYRLDLAAAADLPIPVQPLMAPVVLRHAMEAVDDLAGTAEEIGTLRTALTLAMHRWPEVKPEPRH